MADHDAVAHALAGAGGGILSMALTYPLIAASSRMQVHRTASAPSAAPQPSALAATLRHVIATEGFSGLFSGLSTALLGIGITNGVYYYFFEWSRMALIQASPQGQRAARAMTTVESIAAGTVAGAATVLITNPIWVVNTRVMTRKESMDDATTVATAAVDPSASSAPRVAVTPPATLQSPPHRRRARRSRTLRTIARILRQDGVLAFWQGVVPALILVVNPVIQYTVYERLRAAVESRILVASSPRLKPWHVLVLGALSKLIATSLTYPYIVVKSRMQLRQSSTDPSLRYDSVLDAFRKILKDEGIAGLYRGMNGKLMQSVLTAAFLFYAKEKLYKYALVVLLVSGVRKPRQPIATATASLIE